MVQREWLWDSIALGTVLKHEIESQLREGFNCDSQFKPNTSMSASHASSHRTHSPVCGVSHHTRPNDALIQYSANGVPVMEHGQADPPPSALRQDGLISESGKRVGFGDSGKQYLPRPDVLNGLEEQFIKNKVTMVLHGVSGSGKTCAVKWFAQQDEVRRYFVGGLYYFSLSNGESLSPIAQSAGCIANEASMNEQELLGIQAEVYATLSTAMSRQFQATTWRDGLRLLDSLDLVKPLLIIVDNVTSRDVIDALNIDEVTCLYVTNSPTISQLIADVADFKLPLLDGSECRKLFNLVYSQSREELLQLKVATMAPCDEDIEKVFRACGNRLKDLTLRASFLGRGVVDLSPLQNIRSALDLGFYLSQFDEPVREIYNRFLVFPLNRQVKRWLVRQLWRKLLPGNDFSFLDELVYVGLLESSTDGKVSLH